MPRALYYIPPANEVWGKVIFSQTFVCPQGGIADTPLARHPPGQADTPLDRHIPSGQTPPWEDTPRDGY